MDVSLTFGRLINAGSAGGPKIYPVGGIQRTLLNQFTLVPVYTLAKRYLNKNRLWCVFKCFFGLSGDDDQDWAGRFPCDGNCSAKI